MAASIVIQGARQHNLKNIDLSLPRNRLIVVTGLSGSGKSSLAFDTLYAEGQRRYVESLSTYARQFLERLEKPDVDLIDGLSPAIAIEQKIASHNPRSTVGTVTEIYDFLRLLFARAGQVHCHRCGQPMTALSIDQIVDEVRQLPAGTRLLILAPVLRQAAGAQERLLQRLRKEGFARIRVDGEVRELEGLSGLDAAGSHDLDVVVDRLILRDGVSNRLSDSLELALAMGEGMAGVFTMAGQGSASRELTFSETAGCHTCGTRYGELTPASFSFNSPQGACSECDGLGTISEYAPELIVPNPELSLREGAVAPWAHKNTVNFTEFLDSLCSHYGEDIYTPYKELSREFQDVLLHGSGSQVIPFYFERDGRRGSYAKVFEGVIAQLRQRYRDGDGAKAREEIKRYMAFRPCPVCLGSRLNAVARNTRVAGHTLQALCRLPVAELAHTLAHLELSGKKKPVAQKIIQEVGARLQFLDDVGLGYLTLDRSANTLSGGESQRIRLATQIGSKLTGVLYVLDEPSVGLHPRDNRRLLATLLQMRDLGNTVLVVEHDTETIRAADYVVDMGPGAGLAGGEVVFAGTPRELMAAPHSITGQYLTGAKSIPTPLRRRTYRDEQIVLKGAAANNLGHIDVTFPLGCFICVTGVSGSGKSTLVIETLYRALSQHLYQARITAGAHDAISGLEFVDKVLNIDQSPIGRTPRSNPGTYSGLFTPIRDLFAKTPEARARGFKPGRFSFNVKGGRCEACGGDGIVKIEMHFLPDVFVTCDICRGRRFNRETLEIRYKGLNIADVLDLTVNQALALFRNIAPIRNTLQTLLDVGLGYIRLGQPATTLSGGEAQRLKLSRELSKRSTGRTVYILDEPTTGLHMDDVRQLLEVLNRLVSSGNTVIIIEHNLDVIKTADYVIDLGPEGGAGGGQVVTWGTPEQVAEHSTSHTGRYLAEVLT